MAFKWNIVIIALVLSFSFNITEFECRKISQHGKLNKTLQEASQMFTDFPLGISEVFDDASGVFGKVLGKIITKKKMLGIESFYFRK